MNRVEEKTEVEFASERAFLVSVYFKREQESEALEHLEELALLSETFGVKVIAKQPCYLRQVNVSTFISKGKLEELIALAHDAKATVVFFDEDISPAQQRNLEKAFQLPVSDRTEVILGVFSKHAKSKEAKLQVELAELKYELPRLRRMWTHLSRQKVGGGSGGYLKGEGEKQIEIDRRLLKKRTSKLEQDIREIKESRSVQRQARKKRRIPLFALVGYTNAGKSTLFNALTDAGVLVEDRLFATLDTTTRQFVLKNNQKVLFIDTVGFVRKLPHALVAAFRSTLEEAIQADVLLNLVDISHPAAEDHLKTTLTVLNELGAKEKPIITIFNKMDQCENHRRVQKLRLLYPQTVCLSALKGEGLDDLEEMMIRELKKSSVDVCFSIPQKEYALVNEVKECGHVTAIDYEGNNVIIEASVPHYLAEKLKKYQVK